MQYNNQNNYENERPMVHKIKKKKKKKLRRLIIIELLVIIILIPVAYIYFQLGRIPRQSLDLDNIQVNDIDLDALKGYRNIAVFGVDSRANDLKKNTRSDSIMIVSINKKTKDIKVCSIYRDTYVHIKDHGYTKINHAYAYGGPELAINTINENFDLDITDFVTVNFSAVTNVVDLLGGITLDIQKDELKHVNNYTRDVARINGTDYTYLKKAGKQTVDGTQATAYCRVRYTAGGDFTRAERQRTVMTQIFNKAKKSSIPTMIKLANKMIPQIYTSLSNTEMLSLGKDIFFYDMKDQNGFPFDKKTKKINGVSYVLADSLSSNVSKLHEFLFKQENYEPSKTVQNYSAEIANR
ncbi:LCP family protein [Anaerosporobacter faecicola]|uniref:LCP family protein n=1 Tax=Anaerosporobacter faecicola TaxID=2718714 RepID=UPI00143A5794|nr:LCP family protein [Anaerosporobacter faecicola]